MNETERTDSDGIPIREMPTIRDESTDETDQNRDPDYTLCCGGSEGDEHMIEMEFNSDAATPHWVCPKCGSRSWVAEEQVINL